MDDNTNPGMPVTEDPAQDAPMAAPAPMEPLEPAAPEAPEMPVTTPPAV